MAGLGGEAGFESELLPVFELRAAGRAGFLRLLNVAESTTWGQDSRGGRGRKGWSRSIERCDQMMRPCMASAGGQGRSPSKNLNPTNTTYLVVYRFVFLLKGAGMAALAMRTGHGARY